MSAAVRNKKKSTAGANTNKNKKASVIEISENDVLTLRGAAAQQTQHPGNLFFYSLCEDRFNEYDKILTCTDRSNKLYEIQKKSRRIICEDIVDTVINQPGCFRMWNGSLMSTNQATTKTQERMRQIGKPKLVPPSNVSDNDVVFCAGATNHLFLGNAKLRSLMDEYETQYWPELFPDAEIPEVEEVPEIPEVVSSGDVKIRMENENNSIIDAAVVPASSSDTMMKIKKEEIENEQQQQEEEEEGIKNNDIIEQEGSIVTVATSIKKKNENEQQGGATISEAATDDNPPSTLLSNIKKEEIIQEDSNVAVAVAVAASTTTATTTTKTKTNKSKKKQPRRSIIRKKPQHQIDISNTLIDTIISRGGVFREKYCLKEISVDCNTDDGFEGREMVMKKIHERFRDMKKYFLNGGMEAYKKVKNDQRKTTGSRRTKNLQIQVQAVQQRTTTTSPTNVAAPAGAADDDDENPFQPQEVQSMLFTSIGLSNVASSTSIGDQKQPQPNSLLSEQLKDTQQQQQDDDDNGVDVVVDGSNSNSNSNSNNNNNVEVIKEKYILKRTGVTTARSTITWGGGGTIRRKEPKKRRTTTTTGNKNKKKKRRRRSINGDGDDTDDDDDNGGYNSEIVTSDDDVDDYDDDVDKDEYGDYEDMNTQRKKSEENRLNLNSARGERRKKREQQETNPVVIQQQPKRQQRKEMKRNSNELYIPSESELTTMSEYEKLRYNKMKRNQERLLQLGLINK
jgi:hypothetical protein